MTCIDKCNVTVSCCCAELMELLHLILAKDPEERCKVQQLVGHHWINQDVDMSSYCFQDVVSCRKCRCIISVHVKCRKIK